MTRNEMLAELRVVLNVRGTDVTWTDAELVRYMAEGQDKFCDDTGFFIDGSTQTVTLVEDETHYAISDRVIEVYDVYDGTRLLQRMENYEPVPTTWIGTAPAVWRMDQRMGSISVYPTASSTSAGTVLTLGVWRYAAEYLADTDAEPELPEAFQWACIEWAAYKAFNRHDIDEQDPIKARDHLAAYIDYTKRGKAYVRRRTSDKLVIGSNPAYVW